MDNANTKPHWSFWIISAVALIWNALGSVNFMMQMNPDNIAMYRATEQAIIVGRPLWATAGFGVAVFVGALGGLLLLLRKSWALYALALSLLGALVTTLHSVTVDAEYGTMEIVVILLMPNVVAALLVWYARVAQGKGWVR